MGTDDPPGDAYRITLPAGTVGPFVFASPHSGSHYPDDMGGVPLPEHSLRSAEDALVDRLIACGPAHGAALITGQTGRAYVDLNREPDELDPLLISDSGSFEPSPRAAAGYGVVPRLSGDGQALYSRRLSLEEVRSRVARVHAPYHAALADLMQAAHARNGRAVLVDWHSMPGRPGGPGQGVDVVLGDRHGSSCDPAITRRLRALFEGLGWRVALNHPYAGGYSTRLWAQPETGFHAIQIELSRALYFDEAALVPAVGWSRCEKGLARVIAGLAETVF